MASTLAHRGPDDAGVWVDEAAGIALGHRRLSILDLSPEGHQPMVSACGRYVICFNGEIYNHRELRQGLGEERPWRGHSDTEVLLEALVCWGIERTLARVNGMFAFALWSRRERTLYLARDRLGEKPLYYGESGGHFLFASELKSLRAHPAWNGRVDREALTLFMRFGYVPAPFSIFAGIKKLEPGCWLSLKAGSKPARIQRYWSARAVAAASVANQFRGSEVDAVDALETLMLDAVGLRMQADVPWGAFLSGGIDSSTVVSLMQAQNVRPVRTFSVGFYEADFDEAVHARAIAAHLGCEHTELYLAPNAGLDLLPELPRLWDEPFADVSQIPTYLVAAMAREHVTVCLSGDGGDELFGGYNRHLWIESTARSIGKLPRAVRRLGAAAVGALGPEAWNRLLAPAERLLPGALRVQNPGYKLHKAALVLATDSPSTIYRRLVSHWQQPGGLVIGGMEPRTVLDEEAGSGLDDALRTTMYLDAVTYLPDDILVKLDRASMGVGLEARVPLLDHRLFEFAWTLPGTWKIREGIGKRPLRSILQRYLPDKLVDRPKMGFSVPLGAWLRGPLRDWAEELLDEDRIRREGFLAPRPVREAWHDHLAGKGAWEYRLWNVLMFQAWLESFTHQERPV
jgi:asparagine synthase (glutamine-hydrolysing)